MASTNGITLMGGRNLSELNLVGFLFADGDANQEQRPP
jgi:hypothetical protein